MRPFFSDRSITLEVYLTLRHRTILYDIRRDDVWLSVCDRPSQRGARGRWQKSIGLQLSATAWTHSSEWQGLVVSHASSQAERDTAVRRRTLLYNAWAEKNINQQTRSNLRAAGKRCQAANDPSTTSEEERTKTWTNLATQEQNRNRTANGNKPRQQNCGLCDETRRAVSSTKIKTWMPTTPHTPKPKQNPISIGGKQWHSHESDKTQGVRAGQSLRGNHIYSYTLF